MIEIFGKHTNPRQAAARPVGSSDIGGITATEVEAMRDRFEKFLPGISQSASVDRTRDLFKDVLPEGANWDPRAITKTSQMQGGMGGSNIGYPGATSGPKTYMTTQRPYQPEFECLLEGTEVVLADGTTVPIEHVRPGTQVLDKNGKIQLVQHHWCSGKPDSVVNIVLWGGRIINTTINHNMPVYRNGELIKIPASEIVDGDALIIPRTFDEVPTKISLDEARLLGYYVAEGNLATNEAGGQYKNVEFTFGLHEASTHAKDVENILNSLGVVYTSTELPERNCYRIRARGCVDLVNFLAMHAGHMCYDKKLSQDVLSWPLSLKEQLIKGAYRGDGSQFYVKTVRDGYTSHRFDVTYNTTSRHLYSQMQLILAQLGIYARTKYIGARKRDSGINQSDSWRLVTHGLHASKLADLVWEQASKASEHVIRHNTSRYIVDDNFIYIAVKRVSVTPNVKNVYNIHVSGDNSFLVYNIGTYNSPDRQQYPVHRILANRYWRLFNKLDPVAGNCIDMYGDMPWSPFKLTGPGVEGSILHAMEESVNESAMLTALPAMVREFLITGEAIPHLFFDDEKGYWTHTALHNPDQVEVIDAPFIKMDPILEFIPDDRLRNVLSSNHPALRSIRDKMPPQLLAQLQARQNITLSSINATFIPRKLHPYDTRGTSIMSRLWRIFMYEDAIFNASIQTARRHAGPIKVAKLGNAQTGWIPGPEHEAKLIQLLAQAELDPQAWLVYHYGIAFEMVGNTDRMMTINREWEIIERIKLVALGISKSFLHGEVTYASAATGLQVFLQRLKALRNFFEQKWIIPKFFLPLAEINGWVKRSPAEIQHRFRIKRSQKELLQEGGYIIPKIVWEKSLDPAVDQALITAMQALENMGVRFSKTTKMATIGMSFEEETKKVAKEEEFEKQFLPKIPDKEEKDDKGGGGVGGMPGGGEPPPDLSGGEDMEGESPPPPGGTSGPPPPPGGGADSAAPPGAALKPHAGGDEEDNKKVTKEPQDIETNEPDYADSDVLKSKIWQDNRYGNWEVDEIEPLVEILQTGHKTDSPFWHKLQQAETFQKAINNGDPDQVWDVIMSFLMTEHYQMADIEELSDILAAEGLMSHTAVGELTDMERDVERDVAQESDGLLIGASMDSQSTKKNLNGDITALMLKARKNNAAAKLKKPKRK